MGPAGTAARHDSGTAMHAKRQRSDSSPLVLTTDERRMSRAVARSVRTAEFRPQPSFKKNLSEGHSPKSSRIAVAASTRYNR